MASIVKRGKNDKNISVVYTYVDANGQHKQKWEKVESMKYARERKALEECGYPQL